MTTPCKCGIAIECMCQPPVLTDAVAEIKLQSKYRSFGVVTLYREFRETETISESYHHVVQTIQQNILEYQSAHRSVAEEGISYE